MSASGIGGLNDRTQIQEWVNKLKLNPQISDAAFEIQKAWRKTHVVHANRQSLLAASLYAAIKADPTCSMILLKDFLEITGVNKKLLFRHFRQIIMEIGVKPQECSIRPGPYLDALLVKVGADEKLKARATAILTEYVKTGGSANSPIAIAAASLYAACLERRYEPLPKDQTVDELLRGYNSIVWAPQYTIAGLVGINSATLLNYFYRIKGASPSHVGRELRNKLLENYATNHPREAHIRPNPLNVDKLFKV